jgi:3-phosphoshikimate 1-carboxyvinyltransferase
LPVPSAQVKGAVLLAGLGADGETTVSEPVPLRAHTEELLAAFGADVRVSRGTVTVRRSVLTPRSLDVPGDPSQAAFWVVAACIAPGSDLTVERVYIGPARAGFLDVLVRMGADIVVEHHDEASNTADLHARFGPLRATKVGGSEVPGLIDEIPVLAVAAAMAEGTTVFADAGELAVKESNRIATLTSGLGALGGRIEPAVDGVIVHGGAGRPLQGGTADAHGDHRIGMAMAVAGLAAAGPTVVAGWEAVATSYPTFEEDLRRCVS